MLLEINQEKTIIINKKTCKYIMVRPRSCTASLVRPNVIVECDPTTILRMIMLCFVREPAMLGFIEFLLA